MIVHVQIEVVQVANEAVAFDAVQRPNVVLDLVLIVRHGGAISTTCTWSRCADEFLFFRCVWGLGLLLAFGLFRRAFMTTIDLQGRQGNGWG